MRMTLRTLCLRAGIFMLAGCTPVPAQDASLVRSSDPELARRAAAILPELAGRAGLDLLSPVRVEWREEAALQEYLRYRLERELPEEEARAIVESYALLGLVPAELDLHALLLSVYTEQVAGFYDPDSTALFLMEGQPAAAVTSVLLHELVHAVQDQHWKLDSLTAKERGNDRRQAAHAAIEGHATLVMLEHMTEQLQGGPVDLAEIPDFAASIRPALAAMSDVYPVLAGAPRVIRESLLFPYIEGAGYVLEVWRAKGGRPAPFGEHLPASTRHVLDPGAALEEGLPPPVDLAITPPPGSRVRYENVLGQFEVGILLEEMGIEADAATGWRGDRFALLDQPGGASGLLWVSVWEDDAARDRFLEGLRGGIGLLGEAGAESVRIGGHPGVVLRIGPVRGGEAGIAEIAREGG